MAAEPDGIDDTLRATLRVGLTAAGRVAEVAARQREQQLRTAHAAQEQDRRALEARMAGERQAARAQLQAVHRDDWWERAEPQDILAAWETAVAWRGIDGDCQAAAARIAEQVRERYGLDPQQLTRAAVEHGQAAPSAPGRESEEPVTAQLLVDRADRGDREQTARDAAFEGAVAAGQDGPEGSGPVGWDSPQRRDQLAASLEGVGDREAVDARLVADTCQATPPGDAVAHDPRGTPRAERGGPARAGRIMQRDRGR